VTGESGGGSNRPSRLRAVSSGIARKPVTPQHSTAISGRIIGLPSIGDQQSSHIAVWNRQALDSAGHRLATSPSGRDLWGWYSFGMSAAVAVTT
jgi:hypothetical protein